MAEIMGYRSLYKKIYSLEYYLYSLLASLEISSILFPSIELLDLIILFIHEKIYFCNIIHIFIHFYCSKKDFFYSFTLNLFIFIFFPLFFNKKNFFQTFSNIFNLLIYFFYSLCFFYILPFNFPAGWLRLNSFGQEISL